MPTPEDLLDQLWKQYAAMNKQAQSIHQLLTIRNEKIVNDHIAFRTFNFAKVSIDVLARPFVKRGYVPQDEYQFVDKKLKARHYEHPQEGYPKIFISELEVEKFSDFLQKTVRGLVEQIPIERTLQDDFSLSGVLWKKIPWATYDKLKDESEYAGWMAAFGFRANHFTVFLNALKSFKSITEFNAFLKEHGYALNASGGEVKGSSKDYLEQSSVLADPVEVEFSDGKRKIPGCYYEFAKRYPLPDGRLFQGFVAKSADKIFESTDNKKRG